MDRRQLFQMTSLAAAAAGLPAAASAATGAASVTVDTQFNDPKYTSQIPLNKPRAIEVLDELGLDGLVALRPHNVYYLTNTVTTLTKFGAEYPAFGTFSKKEGAPSFLISSIGNTWETSNGDRPVPEVLAMGSARNWRDYINATPDQMAVEPVSSTRAVSTPDQISDDGGKPARRNGFAVKDGAVLSKREQGWIAAENTYRPNAAPTPAWAIAKALRESGLEKGRIAVDDMRVGYLLGSIGFDVTVIDGDNVFRRIRHVKTDYEVSLMRIAQKITQDSMLAAAHALEPGMRYYDFRQRFFAEGVARGGEPGFVLLGMTQGSLPNGVVTKGESYLMDGSIHFNMYQGDFARTVFVGEPSKESQKRFRAQQIGREEAFNIIKAGVPFRKVVEVAKAAMIREGMPDNVPVVGLHSVGLQHGDDPSRMDVPFPAPVDHVLEENMLVTLDLPYLEVGEGAGHNEDLLRITKTGYEILNSPNEPLVTV